MRTPYTKTIKAFPRVFACFIERGINPVDSDGQVCRMQRPSGIFWTFSFFLAMRQKYDIDIIMYSMT